MALSSNVFVKWQLSNVVLSNILDVKNDSKISHNLALLGFTQSTSRRALMPSSPAVLRGVLACHHVETNHCYQRLLVRTLLIAAVSYRKRLLLCPSFTLSRRCSRPLHADTDAREASGIRVRAAWGGGRRWSRGVAPRSGAGTFLGEFGR